VRGFQASEPVGQVFLLRLEQIEFKKFLYGSFRKAKVAEMSSDQEISIITDSAEIPTAINIGFGTKKISKSEDSDQRQQIKSNDQGKSNEQKSSTK
jgi:hypothetical protein